MIIIYPKLANGNVLWTCDLCGNKAEISVPQTQQVSIYCNCNKKCNPTCNAEYYNTGVYLNSNKTYVNN
jgi:hypothetical protein